MLKEEKFSEKTRRAYNHIMKKDESILNNTEYEGK